MKKKLPIGIQTFSKIIEGDYVYVDKTGIALELIKSGAYYFLSRPRRFGKSLFLDTLKEIFAGNKTLFKGLYIEDKWDFTESNPVIKINFAGGVLGDIKEIKQGIRYALREAERAFDYFVDTIKPYECLQELIWHIHKKYNKKIVLLIDEYDKPILDNITDKEKAAAIRDELKSFFSVIKSNDAYLEFVFLTGISKFSKMNLFSGLNNLNDITLDGRYGTICGYTHHDLETVFQPYLKNADMEKVREWYNGYNYFGEKVYNPFDILLFIDKGCQFKNYWWSTGNPKFLIDLIYSKGYAIPDVENYEATDEILDSLDVGTFHLEALLWQTGYLTIKEKFTDRNRIKYHLEVPNLEIQHSLNRFFLSIY